MILTYNGSEIQQRELDNFVNLTQMAQANKVLVGHWYALDSTKGYLDSLSSVIGIPISQLLIVKKGNSKNFVQGTWAHPLVAIAFGQWISPQFHVWCNMHIKTLLETGKTEIIKPQPKKAITAYSDRVSILAETLVKPPNTWCVIEQCSHLLLDVEKRGFLISEHALLDGSVGIQWGHYRNGKDWALESFTANYDFRNSRGKRTINAYQYPELGYFAQWLQNIYQVKALPIYLAEQAKKGKLVNV